MANKGSHEEDPEHEVKPTPLNRMSSRVMIQYHSLYRASDQSKKGPARATKHRVMEFNKSDLAVLCVIGVCDDMDVDGCCVMLM